MKIPIGFGELFSVRSTLMPYVNSIEIATATMERRGVYLILCWKEKEEKGVTRLSGRAILTHGHSFALLCRNYGRLVLRLVV